jgi:hypothetical protein
LETRTYPILIKVFYFIILDINIVKYNLILITGIWNLQKQF